MCERGSFDHIRIPARMYFFLIFSGYLHVECGW